MQQDSEVYVGLDTSKLKISVALAEAGRDGEVRFLGDIDSTAESIARLVSKLAKRHRRLAFCYEAGPTGYGLYRQITTLGHDCTVVAPSLIPKRPGERVKTNRRDALSLAKLHRAGELTPVWVPDPGHEAVRELVWAREAAMDELRRTRQQLQSFLLRQGRIFPGRKAWSRDALHAQEVECVGKGKVRTCFGFGVKVLVATINAAAPGGQFVLGARALPGNPYDGHTLAAQIAQTERLTGLAAERAYVDRGYRGHDADKTRVYATGHKRGLTPTIRRERRRRNAIEPVIGHMKDDGHLGRNFLRDPLGDAINVILAAAGHNFRLLRTWLARLLSFLLSLLVAMRQIATGRLPETASA